MRAISLLLACVLVAGCMGRDDPPADPTPTPSTVGGTPTPTSPTAPTNATPTPPTNATPTPPTNATPTPPTNATPTPPTPPPPVSIDIVNIAQGYSPATITVPVGTNVTWVNTDAALPHTATADDGSWDTGNIATGASASLVMATPGTFAYHCSLHPVMTASITVQ